MSSILNDHFLCFLFISIYHNRWGSNDRSQGMGDLEARVVFFVLSIFSTWILRSQYLKFLVYLAIVELQRKLNKFFFLFSLFSSCRRSQMDWRSLLVYFSFIVALSACDQDRTYDMSFQVMPFRDKQVQRIEARICHATN